MLYTILKILIFQIFLLKVYISIYYSLYCKEGNNDYFILLSKINEINYFFTFNDSISKEAQETKKLDQFFNYDDASMCWELKSTITKINKFYFFEEAIIREEKRVKVFIAPTNQGLENIYFEYERIDEDDGKASFNFYFKKPYKFHESTTDLSNCADNYEYSFQADSTFYKESYITFSNCNLNSNPVYSFSIKIGICPKYCKKSDCDISNKQCYSNENINNIVQYIQHEWFELEKHVNEVIEDVNNDIFTVTKVENNENNYPFNKYLTSFCKDVLFRKYSPINFFIFFKNSIDPEKTLVLKDNKEKLNYKKYCENYKINSQMIQIMDKKYKLNFSDYVITYNDNDLLNNSLSSENKGTLQFYNESNYPNNQKYPLTDIIFYLRKGIYYSEIITFNVTYGELAPDPNLIGTLNLEIYPFYCNQNKELDNRKCYTNYSMNDIKKEFEKINFNYYEHIQETIINEDNYLIEIFDSSKSDSESIIQDCLEICNKINLPITDLIFIKYKENNKNPEFEIYKSNIFNYIKLPTETCVFPNIISNQIYRISNNSILEINLYDLFSPKLDDSNIYNEFELSSTSAYIGNFFVENSETKTIEQIIIPNDSNNPLNIKSQKIFYYPTDKYYELSLNFELLYFGIKKNLKGIISIEVYPEYCNLNENSNINPKKCSTDFDENFIKNYLISDYQNESVHIGEEIYGPSYKLIINLSDLQSDCHKMLVNLYDLIDNILFQIEIIRNYDNSNIEHFFEYYNKNVNPFEKINEDICRDNTFIIDKTINNNIKINITDVIKSILPKNNNLNSNFGIQILLINDNVKRNSKMIWKESNNLNYFFVEYFTDKYKYYNENYNFRISKNLYNIIKGEINLNVFPIYCEKYVFIYNFHDCYSNKSLDQIIQIINRDDIFNIIEHKNEKIYNENYIFQIQEINSNFQLFSNKIEFEECEREIRKKNSINENEFIYLETIENFVSNEFFFEVYNSKGIRYDSSICNSIIIKKSFIEDNNYNYNNLIYQKTKDLGFNIFDFSSSFYKDFCLNISINENDLTLTDRKNIMFQEDNICYSKCRFINMDKEDKVVKCECNIIMLIQQINLNPKKKEIKFSLINYKFLKCLNLVFDTKIMKNNFGFWFVCLMIVFQIILYFYYFFVGEYSLKLLIETFNVDLSQNIILYNQIIINKKKEDNSLTTSSRMKVLKKENKRKSLEKEIKKYNSSFFVCNLNYLVYSDALKKDLRNFLQMYGSLMREKIPLIKCFLKQSFFEFKSIYIFVYLSYICFIFSFNCLFYDESFISKKFINNGKISTNSYLIRISLSIILNMIITKTVFNFLKYVFSFNEIFIQYKGTKFFKEAAEKKINKMKIKLRLFLISSIILNFLLLYIVASFCALYQKTQLSLFIGGFICLILSFLISLILCFIISSMRFISINYKFEYLYNLSHFLIIIS